jgi:hypothetical protein
LQSLDKVPSSPVRDRGQRPNRQTQFVAAGQPDVFFAIIQGEYFSHAIHIPIGAHRLVPVNTIPVVGLLCGPLPHKRGSELKAHAANPI